MPSSIDKIVDGFPYPTIDPIIGTPYYESIADIELKLNSNAASVQSYLGCGTLGLLFLTVSPTVYATLSTTAFVPPVNPVPEPSIPTGSTGAVISDLRYHHTEATKIFTEVQKHGQSPLSASAGVFRQTIRPISLSQVHRLREDDYSSAIISYLFYLR